MLLAVECGSVRLPLLHSHDSSSPGVGNQYVWRDDVLIHSCQSSLYSNMEYNNTIHIRMHAEVCTVRWVEHWLMKKTESTNWNVLEQSATFNICQYFQLYSIVN